MSERSSSPPEKERTPSSPTLQEPAEFDLRLAMDTIPAIVWTASPDGSDDFFNKNWVEYTNLSVDEAKGFGWLRAIYPDDAPELLARWRAATATATIYECESRVRRFDGEYRWFLSRAVPLRDKSGKVVKWYGTNVDIEDRKRAEARIGQAENDLRLAMDTIPTVVWSAGPDGSADFVSRGWLEYTNLSLEETRGSGWSFAIHPDDRSKFVDKFLKAIAEGTPYEDQGRIRRCDGQYRWFLVRAVRSAIQREPLLDGTALAPTLKIGSEQKRPFAIVSSAFGISARPVPIGTGRLGPIIHSPIFQQTAPKPQMWRAPIEFALGALAGR